VSLGSLAVGGFFTMSGYLIAASRVQTTTGRFLWHRFLRIFPGYWICLLVVAAGFGPAAWWHLHGSIAGYGGAHPLRYVVQNLPLLTPRTDALAGTLTGVPKPGPWNTSLWTLQWELACYLGVVGLARLGMLCRRRRGVIAALLGAVIMIGIVDGLALNLPVGGGIALVVRFAAAFLSGTMLYLYADEVPFDGRLAVLAAGSVAIGVFLPSPHAVIALPLAYLCLWAGARWRTTLCRDVDLSYGVYIYGFPVLQMLALLGVHHHGHLIYFLASVAATLPLAAISFLVVERPAMRARRWTPRVTRPVITDGLEPPVAVPV
jgi:peptidoglycan/LPS O-acetylase OafA/YrhL